MKVYGLILGALLALLPGSAFSANTVRSTDIVDGQVMNVDLAANAVTTAKILDATITSADLANLAVSNGKIAATAITVDKIQDGAVTSAKILDGSVGNADLAANAVTNDKILDGTISGAKLAMVVYTKGEVDALIAGLQAQITALTSRVAALEDNPALALGSYVSVTAGTVNGAPGPNVVVSGANLHIVNGLGFTTTYNGLGNLIVGYNELRNDASDDRSGSHTFAVGMHHSYASYGGLVTGWKNSLVPGAGFGVVLGGGDNTAAANYGVVVGGQFNSAQGDIATVLGGYRNNASAFLSTVTGGMNNLASGNFSTVSGGQSRSATGDYDWVAGSLFEDQ